MPGYRGHLVGGVVVYSLLLLLLQHAHPSISTLLIWLGATCAGALFPDIDIKSKGQKYFYWVLLCVLLWSIWRFKKCGTSVRFNIVAVIGVLSVLPMLVKHRGITHRYWFIMVLALTLCGVIRLWCPLYVEEVFYCALFFVAGAFSHIWLDYFLSRYGSTFFSNK